jgi:RNA polymerase sigma factor (sigma-70 family)
VDACIAGDRNAKRCVVETFAPGVACVLKRCLASTEDDVPDLTAEVLERVFSSLRSWRDQGPGSLRAWINTIARHIATDQLRRDRSRWRVERSGVQFVELSWRPPNPAAVVEARELLWLVLTALGRLDPQRAELVWLRVFEGLTYEQLGAEMRLAKTTAMRRTKQAICAFNRHLARLGIDTKCQG